MADRVIISTQGDWWDTLAMKAYGMKRGNERLMYKLIEANFWICHVSHFPAGVKVYVPELPVVAEVSLVPWKKASQLPSQGGGL